jgi:pyruvate dehydrogenase E2 component (dihydrolipoamide acetyltransferase)
MATEITMPQLSESMEEGTILKWLVEQGGEVKKGEPLVEIETDKANTTYDAEADGTLVEVLAKEGDTLAVGAPIARLGDADEGDEGDAGDADAGDDADGDGEADADAEPSASEGAPREQEPGTVSPIAERVADEEGVDIAAMSGSGPGGRIVKEDVERVARGGAKGDVEITELTRLQQTVSRRMAESKATAPDYALTVDVDMTLAVELRERLKDSSEHPPSVNDMVIKATANALRDHPKVNGAYRDGKFEQYSRVNVGIAVAAQDALVVPTIFDADSKSLGQITRDAYELAEKVREGKITPPEVAGGTFTITNLGMYGIDEFTAVINPPQAATLTVGALKKRPAVDENGRVVARDQMRLTLVCDQRILYGADAAEFLARVRELLEQPLQLAL